MSVAQFKQDVQDGSAAAKSATKDMADTVGANSREAAGSLALIGEEIGVTIPRHLRTFITSLPGVATALSSAFTGVAVIALIELITKIVEKIQDYRDHLAESADAWDQTNQKGTEALRALDASILALDARLEELAGDHLGALQAQLRLIDNQTLTQIQSEFAKTATAADDAFKKMQVGWTASMLGFGNDSGVKNVAKEFDALVQKVQALANAGNSAGIGDVIDKQIQSVLDNMVQINSFNGQATAGGKAIYDALQNELDQLNLMYAQYSKIKEISTDKTAIDTEEERARALAESAKMAKQLQGILDSINKMPPVSWTVSKGGTNPYSLPAPSGDTPLGTFSAPQVGNAGLTPLYGGTKEAKDQLNLLTDQNEQLKQAAQLYSDTRTESERYTNEVQALNTLLASGAIDQDTYNRALSEAKTKYDAVTQGLTKIGETIGQDIGQAALYGGSWVKAFQDIAAEIVKVVIQMTLLKSLQNAAAASGGGGGLGFLASIFGGLAGKAAGGPVYQGEGYMVGENGPEFFSPTTSGTIIPNPQFAGSGPATVVNHQEFHFHGVTDADSFRKSQSQISAAMAAQMSRHAQRNG
jgi:hypothetical protein